MTLTPTPTLTLTPTPNPNPYQAEAEEDPSVGLVRSMPGSEGGERPPTPPSRTSTPCSERTTRLVVLRIADSGVGMDGASLVM